MAQVLKDGSRESILKNASEEFLEQGFEKASMRRIAEKSKMTVGNLYRYFKNKDELSDTIVSPTYSLINGMIEKITGGRMGLGADGSGLPEDPQELGVMLKSLSSGLVDIYRDHRTEVNILMMGSRLNKELTSWFAAMIGVLISRTFGYSKEDSRVKLLSVCYADAIFSGIRTILRNFSEDEESLKNMVLIYLNSYLSILGQDLPALI